MSGDIGRTGSNTVKTSFVQGRIPGLVVMGDDSCSRGHGFKTQHHILDGNDIFSH